MKPCEQAGRPSVMMAAISFLLILSIASTAAQTTYYVDPAGNDGATGTAPGSAWRTVAKVNGSSFSPGDQILFLRGGVWSEQLVPSSSGTSSAPIIFGAYGSGPRPVINAGGALPGWNSTGNWTDLGGNVWSCSYGRYPAAVWLNGQLYGTSGNNSGAGSSTPSARYRWWHDGNSTFKVYSEGNPATTYNQIEIANLGRNTLVASGKSYLIFRSLEFRRGQRGADLSNCDFITFDSCAFLGTPQFSLWIQDGSDDGEIKNCTFDTGDTVSHPFEFTGDAGTGNGGDIIAIQWGNRWKIHGNTIANPGHDCINLSGGDPSGAVSQNNQIYCNEMYMNGGDYGRPFDIQGFSTPGTCSNNRVTRNYIHGFPIQAQVLGQSNELSYNIFADGKLCPWRTDNNWYASSAISLCDYIGNGENSNKVWNNTVINCQSAGIVVYPGQSRASVKNNIVYNTGLAAGRFTQNVGICIWQGTTYDTVFNNAIYNSGANPVVYEQQLWTTNTPISVSSFNTMSGGSYGNVIAGNIGSDPLLASDNTLQSSSPCIKAGVNVGLTVDYAGVSVTSPPDVGARQSGTAPSPPPLPAAPMLASPANGTTLASPSVTLTWLAATGADRYRVQVATDLFLTFKKDTVLGSGVTTTTFAPLVSGQVYYWRVAGINSAGAQGPYSSGSPSFSYTAPPPPPPPATGPVTYYVRNDGNDGNIGTSDAAAWASVARVNQATLNPGDRVLFKSGGLWAEQLSPASSGTSMQPILYGAYGSGARPVIDASGPLPGWNSTASWTPLGGSIWQFTGTRSPGRLWLSGVEYGASGDAAGNGVSTPNSRYRWWSDGVKLLVYSPGGNPATAYSSITAASVGRLAMSLGGQSYLVFRGLDFRGGETCIELRNADFVTFDSCSILRGTSRYGLVARDGSDNGVVSNCQLDRADSVAHAFVYGGDETGGNGQDNLLLLGASHWDIGRNTIADFGHVGVMLSGNRASGLYTTDNKIHDNNFFLRSADFGSAYNTEGDASGACTRNDFYYNRVHNTVLAIQLLGDHNRCYYNLIDTMRISSSFSTAYHVGAFEFNDYAYSDSNEVLNNAIRNCDGAGITVRPNTVGAKVINNILIQCGLKATNLQAVGIGLWAGTRGGVMRNNVIYSGGGSCIVYGQRLDGPVTKISVSSFNGISDGLNTIGSNLGKDPRLSAEMKIPSNSCARDAGLLVGLTRDYFGDPVPYGGAPDIGAYERSGGQSFTFSTVQAVLGSPTGVMVEWGTLSELSSVGFYVQRKSATSGDYTDLPNGYLQAAGTSTVPRSYAFLDTSSAGRYDTYRIRCIDSVGTSEYTDEVAPNSPMSVAANSHQPFVYALAQNYPNPFNPATEIAFTLPEDAHATLEVYNIVGQRVAVLVDELRHAGVNRISFSGRSLASGMYIYRLKASGQTVLLKKMTLVK